MPVTALGHLRPTPHLFRGKNIQLSREPSSAVTSACWQPSRRRLCSPQPPAASAAASDGGALQASTAAADETSSACPHSTKVAAQPATGPLGWLLARRHAQRSEVQRRLGKLGLAAVLAYGALDAATSAVAFVLAFLAYEARSGINPARSPADLAKVVVLMWASKHVTRPFRWAAVAALTPLADRLLSTLQLRLGCSRGTAFVLCVAAMAVCCLSGVGGLLLTRWLAG